MKWRFVRLALPPAGTVLLLLAVALGVVKAQTGMPGAPTLDSVAAGDRALTAAWSVPSNTGLSFITAYDLRYILTSEDETIDANWTVLEDVWSGAGDLLHTLTGVDNGSQYDVQVRAVNSHGEGPWSSTVAATPSDHGGSTSSATSITLRTPTLGYISSTSDDDYFSFTVAEDTGIFIFTTSYASGFIPVTGDLRNSSGGVIKADDTTTGMKEHGEQLFIWDDLSAGTYYVRVEAPETGYYTLHAQPVPDGTSITDAVGLDLGGRSNGVLNPAAEEEDFYRFELSSVTDVMIWLPRASEDFDPLGTLLNSDGDVITSHDDSFLDSDRSEHFIIRENLNAGTYYLKVVGAAAASFDVCHGYTPEFISGSWTNCEDTQSKSASTTAGAYTVAVESVPNRGSSTASATALTLGENAIIGGRINSNTDSDYFSITVGTPTHVKVEIVSAHIETEAAFFDNSRVEQEVLASDRDYLPGGLRYTLFATLDTGTSYIRVKSDANSSAGPYAIRATVDEEYTDMLSTCTALSTGYPDPLYGCQWSMKNTGQDTGDGAGASGEDINVEDVWDAGNLGEGINIAIVDNGLYYEHEDLKDNVDTSKNFDYTPRDNVFERHFIHGTAMAGLIAARDNNTGMRGVAPRATIFSHNWLRYTTFFRMQHSQTENMETTGIYNNSWGYTNGPGLDPSPRIWELAIESGVNEGMDGKGSFYVYSAGNGGDVGDYSNLSGIANFYAVTAACAVNDQGERPVYSEQGSNLWVCAPSGDHGRQGNLTTTNYNRYQNGVAGTSTSAAIVSGVAALVRKANPDLTWRDVKLILAGSARKNDPSDSGWATGATKYGSSSDTYNYNHQYGFGVVDAKAAVDLAASWTNLPAMTRMASGSSPDLDLAIADNGSASNSITVGRGVNFIEYVNVFLKTAHHSFRDLKVELTSPAGTTSVLTVSHDSDDKYPLNGEFRFGTAAHLGENPSGAWTIRITDEVAGASGTLKSWRIEVLGHQTSSTAPTISSVTPGNASLFVGWTALDDAAVTAYDVRHIETNASDKADANWTVVDDAVTSGSGYLSYTISGLTNGTSYDVQVRGVRGSDDGNWSDTVVGTPSAGSAAIPAISAVRSEDTALYLTWNAPTSPPSTTMAYDVQYKVTDSSTWTVIDNAWTEGALSYSLTGLTNFVSYDIQVRHVGDSDGAWSSTAAGQPRDFGGTLATAGTLVLNSPMHGDINTIGDEDVFKFDLTATKTIWIYTTGNTDTVAELVDSEDTIVASDDDGDLPDSGLNFLLTATLDAGSYHLRVKGFGNTTGAYVLHAEEMTDSTSRSDAITLPLDGTALGSFEDSLDQDYFKLVLTEETEVVLRSTGRRDTVASLTNSSGVEIASNDDGYFGWRSLNFLIRTRLPAGTYYLVIHEFFGRSGGFKVHAESVTEPGSDAANAYELTLGVAGGGNIDVTSDTDYFKFTLAERTSVILDVVSHVAGVGYVTVSGELQDSAFTSVETFAGSTSDELVSLESRHTLDAGAYYVKLTWTTDLDSEDYSIIVLENPSTSRAEDRCSVSDTGLSDALAGCQWHLKNEGQLGGLGGPDLNVESVWSTHKGSGINVVVVDDGLDYEHEDLSANVDLTSNYSYVDGETVRDLDPWHGTAVGGIIAADDNDIGVRGVAPDATIYSYNLLSAEETDENEADAMSRNSNTTAVSNNSWGPFDNGLPQSSPSIWKMAVENGVKNGYDGKGVFYVWAGGNGGSNDYSSLDEYANFYGVTAVCAVNYEGRRSSYSESGANLWVCGPSNHGGRFFTSPSGIAALMPGITTTYVNDSYTYSFGGTSAAAPMVSGVVALMRQANNALTWRDIKLILAATARKVDANDSGWTEGALKYGSGSDRYHFSYEYGFGLVDAKAAVDEAIGWTTAPAFREIEASSEQFNLSIPDSTGGDYPVTVTDTLTIDPHVGFIEYVHVRADINHTSIRDLQIELVSPEGVVSVLSPYLEGGSFFFSVGGPWDGEFQFGTAKHLGENGAGEWTLRITDRISGDTGTLRSWSITVYGHGDGPGFPEINTATSDVRGGTVTWTAPTITGTGNITSYDLRHREETTDSNWVLEEDVWTSGPLSYTLTGLKGGSKYDVQVRAKSVTGVGPWSESQTIEPILSTPTAPTITRVSPGNLTLGITWTPPPEAVGDEITSYDLRYILTGADETVDSNWTVRTRTWTAGPLHFAQSGLANGSGYDVQVRAVNSEGAGAWSPTAEGTPADQVNLRLQWSGSNTTVDEDAGTVTLQAQLVTTVTGTLSTDFVVDVDVAASGTADPSADYTLQTTSLTFVNSDFSSFDDGGQTRYRASADVTIVIKDDTVNENDEQINLSLAYDAPSLPHLQGNNARLTVTVSDNDHGPVNVSWQQSSVTVDEGDGSVTLRAVVTTAQDQAPDPNFRLQASVSSVAGTAAKTDDFTPLIETLTFSGNSFRRSTVDGRSRYQAVLDVLLPIIDDSDDEEDEELTVVLSYLNPTLPHLQGSSAAATVTIRDNDFVPVTLSWDLSTIDVDEHAGTVTLQAHATTNTDKMPESGFSVLLSALTVDDTASQGLDYRSSVTNFSFNQGDFTRVDTGGGVFRYRAVRDITVSLIDDTVDEADETFSLALAYRGATRTHYTGGSAEAIVTIIDNELPQVRLGWEESAITIEEPTTPGGTTTVTLTALAGTLGDKPPESGFTLDFSVNSADGTAVEPTDYQQLSETVSIPRTDFTIDTTGGQTRYTTSRTYTLFIEDDTIDEPNETLTVTLAFDDPGAPYLIPGNMTATITIEDNDHVATTLGWHQTEVSANEPATSGGTTTVTLRARAVTETDKQPETGFVLDYSVSSFDGTASDPADYAEVSSNSESFTPADFSRQTVDGQHRFVASRDFTVTIADDTVDEPDETFTVELRLLNPSLPHLSEGDNEVTVTINDNDHVPVELSWEQSFFTVDEDAGAVTLKAEMTTISDKMPESGFAAVVSVETVDDSATRGADYNRLSTSHTFRQNDFTRIDTGGGIYRYRATREFNVTIREDTTDEESEQFEVVLAYSNPGFPHLTGSSADATIAITDNDHVPITLGWEEILFTAEEPTSVGDTTPVTLTARAVTATNKQPESGFTFDFTASTLDGSARQPEDYQPLSETVTFDRFDFSRDTVDGQPRWVAERDFTVHINHDTITQETENFRVRLEFVGSSQPYLLRGDMTATVTVTDDASSLSDLSTTISVNRNSATFGDRLTYDWSVTNSDVSDTTNASLVATLSPGVTFVSAEVASPVGRTCTRSGRSVTCTLGTLAQFDPASGSIVVEVADSASEDISFSARAQGDQLDRTPGDNDESAITELEAPPRTITDLRAAGAGGHIDLSWSRPVDNGSIITSYELERKSGTDAYSTLTPPNPNALSYLDEDVEQGVTYTYRLRASNEDGAADWSNEAEGQRSTPPSQPSLSGGSGSGGGGGGGGGGGSSNRPPAIEGPRSLQYEEHDTEPVATYEATDPDGTSITWSIEDTDAEHFRISDDGVLTFVRSPDYENPVDFRLNNTYEIRIIATDSGIPRASARLQVRIEIKQVNEIGPITGETQISVEENSAGVLSRYQAEDPEGDALAWSLTGPDAGFFQMDDTGTLSLIEPLDFEAQGSDAGTNDYSLNIVVTDDNRRPISRELPVTVTVTNVNEGPISIQETPTLELTAGDATATFDLTRFFADSDGDSLTYELADEAESNAASVTLEESILFITPLEGAEASFEVTASDPEGLSVTFTVSVVVANPPPPPPTPEPTPAPTPEPTPAPTPTPTPAPTAFPTQTPGPTPTSTPEPTATPTATPTPISTPTVAPSPTPTPEATPTPRPSPSPTSTPAPSATTTPAPAFTAIPAQISTLDDVREGEPESPTATEGEGIPTWAIALIVMGFLFATIGGVIYAYRRLRRS